MKILKKDIMRLAWKDAKFAAKRFAWKGIDCKASDFFAECLKKAWAGAKRLSSVKPGFSADKLAVSADTVDKAAARLWMITEEHSQHLKSIDDAFYDGFKEENPCGIYGYAFAGI